MEKEIKEFMDWFEESREMDGGVDREVLRMRVEILVIQAKNLGIKEAFNMLKEMQ